MEGLPDLVVAKIATYLRPRDILVCSAVCKKWRERFNIDRVWAPRLKFPEEYYKIQEKYKDMILCPPHFSSLQPLCDARECFSREQCLRFNLKAGLFTAESFHPKTDSKVNQIVNHLDKNGHYWLFLTFTHTIEVWNITNKPFFQTRADKKLPFPIDGDSLYVLDTKVLLVYSNSVQVYSFEGPKYKLVFQCGFFNDQESSPMEVQGPLRGNFNQLPSRNLLVGNILIGYPSLLNKSMLPTARLHVWNMDTLVKLDAVKITYEPLSHCYEDEEENDSKNWVGFQLFKGENDKMPLISTEATGSSITIFDLREMKFLEFFKPYNRVQIHWSKIVDERIHLIATLQKIMSFATTTDFHGTDGVIKNLTKTTGMDYTCLVNMNDWGLYAKTGNDLWFIGVAEGKMGAVRLLDNFEHNKMVGFTVAGRFVFSRSDDGFVKMWDLDKNCQVKELPLNYGNIEISDLTFLPFVDCPPKIIFPNTDGNLVRVLSFW